MDKPFLLIAGEASGEFHFRAINLMQVVSFSIEDRTVLLRMSSGDTYRFANIKTMLQITELIGGMSVFPDGSPAEEFTTKLVEMLTAPQP